MGADRNMKNSAAPLTGEDRHRHLMEELNRIMRYLFDDDAPGNERVR